MRDSYQVLIKEPRRGEPAVVEAVNMNVVEREQTATGDRVEPLSIEGIESRQDAKRWKPYEDSKYESPVLNRLVPWPVYYFCRWKILQVFHTRLLFGIVLGEVLVFLLLVGGLAGVLAAMGMNREEDAAEETGGVAVIPTALSFAFACRNSLWVLFTGLPFERALFWHKLCAYLSVLTGAWHGYLSNQWDASGLVLTGAMAVLCIFALWFIRRHIFEAFYRFHWILFLVVIVASFAHGAGAIAFGVGLWLFDILVRLLITFLNNKHQRSILAVRLPSNVVRLTFLKRNFNYKSGQYCFICVPGVSFFEWHPFSLSSSPHENTVSLHIRVLGDWTQRLYDYVDRTRQIDVYLDGPYGAPCLDVDGDRYKMFMFVSGGIGITPMQSICNDVLYQRRRGRDIKKVMLFPSLLFLNFILRNRGLHCDCAREQGWRSDVSTHLPPMWPGFDSRTRHHMWVKFVVSSHPCSEGFSPGTPVFPPSSKKLTFLNSNLTRNLWRVALINLELACATLFKNCLFDRLFMPSTDLKVIPLPRSEI